MPLCAMISRYRILENIIFRVHVAYMTSDIRLIKTENMQLRCEIVFGWDFLVTDFIEERRPHVFDIIIMDIAKKYYKASTKIKKEMYFLILILIAAITYYLWLSSV